jgi:hypothetical protein
MIDGVEERKVTPQEWEELVGFTVPDSRKGGRKTLGRFISPLPLKWAQAASRLSGRCVQVALVIWYHWRLGRRVTVALTHAKLEAFGISPKRLRESLDRLEAAGLVSVTYSGKRSPRVIVHEKGGASRGNHKDGN